MSADPGRDELIDARAERDRVLIAAMSSARAIGALMEDRVRHMTALRQIALMTETGIAARGGHDVHVIAVEALTAETDMSWWPDDVPAAAEREAGS